MNVSILKVLKQTDIHKQTHSKGVSLETKNAQKGEKWRLGFIKSLHITKTRLYNFDPLKPHFYIVKLGFTGVYIIFLISA